jgi:hypothetical protein
LAYPDLPPSPTFWRCPHCGQEATFRANGVSAIACGTCKKESTAEQLVEAHKKAHASAKPAIEEPP